MDFNENKPIYLQIADKIMEKILNHTYKEGDRLPSVREAAADAGVNANTMMRTYTRLEQEGVIYTNAASDSLFRIAAGNASGTSSTRNLKNASSISGRNFVKTIPKRSVPSARLKTPIL